MNRFFSHRYTQILNVVSDSRFFGIFQIEMRFTPPNCMFVIVIAAAKNYFKHACCFIFVSIPMGWVQSIVSYRLSMHWTILMLIKIYCISILFWSDNSMGMNFIRMIVLLITCIFSTTLLFRLVLKKNRVYVFPKSIL